MVEKLKHHPHQEPPHCEIPGLTQLTLREFSLIQQYASKPIEEMSRNELVALSKDETAIGAFICTPTREQYYIHAIWGRIRYLDDQKRLLQEAIQHEIDLNAFDD